MTYQKSCKDRVHIGSTCTQYAHAPDCRPIGTVDTSQCYRYRCLGATICAPVVSSSDRSLRCCYVYRDYFFFQTFSILFLCECDKCKLNQILKISNNCQPRF
jgi:hypothetical protein